MLCQATSAKYCIDFRVYADIASIVGHISISQPSTCMQAAFVRAQRYKMVSLPWPPMPKKSADADIYQFLLSSQLVQLGKTKRGSPDEMHGTETIYFFQAK